MALSNLSSEQLDRLVEVYKALADPARIRIMALLSEGDLNGKEIAEALSLSQPTITHHMSVLRNAGLVTVQRVNTSHLYSQNLRPLLEMGEYLRGEERHERPSNESEKVWNDFTENGKLKSYPAQRKKRLYILERLSGLFSPGVKYPEREVNAILSQYHPDYATLRREMIMNGLMARDKGFYWILPHSDASHANEDDNGNGQHR
ncbi:MAG: metalloregulator ArsR/SmtB family transcription factor [Firmicutes bacterium]|jgi:biotin operon repressor|nr:metalloregulator ArsR/SmtB family transcription factor [Bacillota bacterium]